MAAMVQPNPYQGLTGWCGMRKQSLLSHTMKNNNNNGGNGVAWNLT
tara:strand:- start:8849 stop:8986 length:138 start_codon:yes stop_codon:yes gene_type:complete